MKTFIDRFKKIIADDGGNGTIIAANKLYECDAIFATQHCDEIDQNEDHIDEYMNQVSMTFDCHLVPKMLMCFLNDMTADQVSETMVVTGNSSRIWLYNLRWNRIQVIALAAAKRRYCNYGVTV